MADLIPGNQLYIYKVLICGDRFWTEAAVIKRVLRALIKKHGTRDLVIITGKAQGADQLAGYHARSMNVHVADVAALWDTRHNGAGPQRNRIMLALLPDLVIGFHDDLKRSKGTKDMLKQAEKVGIRTKHYTSSGKALK